MKKILATFLILGALAVGFGIVSESITDAQVSQIPNHLKLKAPKERVLKSEHYKNREGIDETMYQYVSETLVPIDPNELIEKRLPDAKFFPGQRENEYVAEITLGDAYHKQGSDWYRIDYATTTKEAFEEQTRGRLGRLVSQVFADDFVSSNNSYVTGNGGASYANARLNSSGFSNTAMQMGQIFVIGQYEVYRPFMKFNTSTIGSGSTVSQVNFRGSMSSIQNAGAVAFDLDIFKYDWSGQDPLSAANREAAFDGCLASTQDDNIWLNIIGKSTNTAYTSGNLDTAWVNTTGSTYYCYRQSNDTDSVAPLATELVVLNKNDNATVGLRPTLIVTFSAAAPSRFGDLILFE